MRRREFIGTVGAGAGAAVLSGGKLNARQPVQQEETADEIYQRAYSTDAMCFGAHPPRTYVPVSYTHLRAHET